MRLLKLLRSYWFGVGVVVFIAFLLELGTVLDRSAATREQRLGADPGKHILRELIPQPLGKLCRDIITTSYDLFTRFQVSRSDGEIALILLGDEYKAKTADGRRLLANLLERLTVDRPRVVVLDVLLRDQIDPDADKMLVAAMTNLTNSGVKLIIGCAEGREDSKPSVRFPLKMFDDAATGVGIMTFQVFSDGCVRMWTGQQKVGDDVIGSLAWTAASAVGAQLTDDASQQMKEFWLNYYGRGRPLTLNPFSSTNAIAALNGFFKERYVFIGAAAEGAPDRARDAWNTPYTLGSDQRAPGVEIHATAFLNVLRNKFLSEAWVFCQVAAFVLIGVVAVHILNRCRPRQVVMRSLLLMVGTILLAYVAFLFLRVWFHWTVPTIQIATAALWVILAKTLAVPSIEDIFMPIPIKPPVTEPLAIPSDFKYHAFISYRHLDPDREFAWQLTKFLESHGFVIAIDRLGFDPQATVDEQMLKHVEESQFTLAVFSSQYLKSDATKREAWKALDLKVNGRSRLVKLTIERATGSARLEGLVGLDFTRANTMDPSEQLAKFIRDQIQRKQATASETSGEERS